MPILEQIKIDNCIIEQVTTTKLLGVHISSDLTWTEHVNEICKKANARIFQLYALKRAGVKVADLVLIYVTSIRPVLEYACEIWHPGLNLKLTAKLEYVQKRALRIIIPSVPYPLALVQAKIPTLEDRRVQITKRFFIKMQDPSHKLHKMLPLANPPKYQTRNAHKYPLPRCHTNRYKNSFIPFCLYNFQ